MKFNGKVVKTICLAVAASVFCGIFTGCYDKREIDELGYVLALGIDKGITNNIKMTFQFAIPQSPGGGGGGGGEASKKGSIEVIEAPTIYAGLNLVNVFVSKQVNLSHAKVIVFSEELAKNGMMGEYVHALERGREFRPNMFIAIARDSAEEYIRNVNPTLVLNPSKYYELAFEAYRYTGFSADTKLHYFYTREESQARQPVADLVGVSGFKSSKEFSAQASTYKEKGRTIPLEGDFKAGDAVKYSESKAEVMGLAVFNEEKMVGELDGEETMFYLMVTGEFNYNNTSVPDPLAPDRFVLINLKQSRQPRNSVSIVNGKPVINVELKLEGDFLSIQSGKNYEDIKNLPIMESAAEQFIKAGAIRFLNRTSKELHSDICGFGEKVQQQFLTWDQWQNFKWFERYKDAVFNVGVDVKIRRTGQMIRSVPPQSSGG